MVEFRVAEVPVDDGAARLPSRAGQPPVVSVPRPHEQVTQTAPRHLQQRLLDMAAQMPGVRVGPSFVSVDGTRGFHLVVAEAPGPAAFHPGTEFAHLHPGYDGSLHMHLPAELKDAAVRAGWGTPHPWNAALLVYGPRDEDEFTVVWTLLRASYRYARTCRPGLGR